MKITTTVPLILFSLLLIACDRHESSAVAAPPAEQQPKPETPPLATPKQAGATFTYKGERFDVSDVSLHRRSLTEDGYKYTVGDDALILTLHVRPQAPAPPPSKDFGDMKFPNVSITVAGGALAKYTAKDTRDPSPQYLEMTKPSVGSKQARAQDGTWKTDYPVVGALTKDSKQIKIIYEGTEACSLDVKDIPIKDEVTAAPENK